MKVLWIKQPGWTETTQLWGWKYAGTNSHALVLIEMGRIINIT